MADVRVGVGEDVDPLLEELWLGLARRKALKWWERVSSGSNLADLPSRGHPPVLPSAWSLTEKVRSHPSPYFLPPYGIRYGRISFVTRAFGDAEGEWGSGCRGKGSTNLGVGTQAAGHVGWTAGPGLADSGTEAVAHRSCILQMLSETKLTDAVTHRLA